MRIPYYRWIFSRCGRRSVLLFLPMIAIIILTAFRFQPESVIYTEDGLTQKDVDYFASNIQVRFKMLQNNPTVPESEYSTRIFYEAEITLTNIGNKAFPNYGWSIFFNQIHLVEPDLILINKTALKPEYQVLFRHINGELYSIEPMLNFNGIKPNESKQIRYYATCCSGTYTDVFPNWYIVFRGLLPRVLASTVGEPDNFVEPFDTDRFWKRVPDRIDPIFALFNPPTQNERFLMNVVVDMGKSQIPVIPTPLNIEMYNPSSAMNVLTGDWVIVSEPAFPKAAMVLYEKWRLKWITKSPSSNYIQFIKQEVNVQSLLQNETYELHVNPAAKSVTIKAMHEAGAFYAVQSLLSLTDQAGNVPETIIKDGPRYRYRGLMIDVARNFHNKETIMRNIDVMAMYKLNKLHLHLSDDEGWRLEIPDLPELTEVGGKRCHDLSETKCLLPFLGSGPDPVAPGSGFYTIEDYKDILHYAAAHHVEVIPEIDMPGHSHAAIKAMYARYLKLSQGTDDLSQAARYLLSDLKDKSIYKTAQQFNDDVINPCIESTYAFIQKIITTLQNAHKDINPLQTFHFGGDEVPWGVWLNSPICAKVSRSTGITSLRQMFAKSVAELAHHYNLNLAAWEDGLMEKEIPIPRKTFLQKNIYAYTWNNLWTLNQAKRAYALANEGYKVVLTPATSTYLDHSHEPDSKERGLIWATRFINTKKIFKFMPENVYISTEFHVNGEPILACSDQNKETECPDLMLKDNIEGIQGTLFGELVRSSTIMDFMVLPRLLAIAERAWHAAPWEFESRKDKRDIEMEKDWVNFANTLGYKELARLDREGFLYRIPPPSPIVIDNKINASLEFPGLEVQISMDGGNKWIKMPVDGMVLKKEGDIQLRTKAAAGNRYSRIVHL